MKYNFESGTKVEIQFDQSEHRVYESCSVNYRGRVWIFGGKYDLRKVSTVEDCGLKRKSVQLPEIGINYFLF